MATNLSCPRCGLRHSVKPEILEACAAWRNAVDNKLPHTITSPLWHSLVYLVRSE